MLQWYEIFDCAVVGEGSGPQRSRTSSCYQSGTRRQRPVISRLAPPVGSRRHLSCSPSPPAPFPNGLSHSTLAARMKTLEGHTRVH
ncbi:hypothetical protein RRG08_035738 [Elysia crispata]|uniref:Uncharacterized protein n=1 Tax=Elysia crispata TaxID=231223 RepID=A0AAE1CZC0_9GAST|nr:hypothetical protein RRG08_035738 [Elysia crispata]